MVVRGPGNRGNVQRSRSVDGIDGRGERDRRIRREGDCTEVSMENFSDGSQECVFPISKRRQEKRQELATLRSYAPPTGQIRNTALPSQNFRQTYKRANSAEELSFGERTPNSLLSKNGVVQRRLLRRRSFGGLEPSDDSTAPGESSPLPIPRNYKCCDVVMAEIVEKLKSDNHGKNLTQSQRSDSRDHVNRVCNPLVSVSQHDSKPLIEKERTPSKLKRRGSTGHLRDTNTRIQTYSMDGQPFLSKKYGSISNHEQSTTTKLSNNQGKQQQDMPKMKGSLRQEKKCGERRIVRRELSNGSLTRRETVVREKQKSSPIDLRGQDCFANENVSGVRVKRTDRTAINNDDIPSPVEQGAKDYLRTRRRQRMVQRNLSGPLVKPVRANMNGLATAVPKEDLFLIWLKQQNCNNNKPHSDAGITRVSSVNSTEGNERSTRQGATTLSDRRAMRQDRRRNSQTT